MDVVVAVTMIRVSLLVLHVCMLRECEDEMVTTMLVWGLGVCGCGDYGELLYDVLEMSVVRGVRGVCGVCEIYVFGSGWGRR